MSNPYDAPHYADQAVQESVEIVEHQLIARQTRRVRLRCPEIARRLLPGQFLMLRAAGTEDPLIGRPLAMYDVYDEPNQPAAGVDVVYLVKGKFTQHLAQLEVGQPLEVWGPLGNGFQPQPTEHLIMVAGGIGQTPFLSVAREYLGLRQFGTPARAVPPAERITFCYGARQADYLAGVEDFQALGIEVRISTDDGSRGHHGLVTDDLEKVLSETKLAPRILCCGPEPMMEAVAQVAERHEVPCQVSLETPMACGIGICFSCVAKVREGEGWDYKRTCVEGPVFDAEKVVW